MSPDLTVRVLILTALVSAALALPATAQAEPNPISSAAQLFTCCTPPALQDRLFEEAAASGARYVRVDVELHGIFGATGSRDHPDWRNLDAMIERARRYGVRVLGLIRGTPVWLSSCPNRPAPQATICAPRDSKEWGRLAGEVAAHARGEIDHWEILNEPDATWAFTGSAEDYARMLSAAYDAIKAAAPEDQVVFGGVERPRDHGWIDRVLATPGADAVHKFDIAAVHLRLRLRNTVPELAQWLVDWRQLLARHGFHGPIWATEHGYPADPAFQWDPAYRGTNVGTGEDAQAALLDRTIPLLARAGASQIFVTLRDNLYGEYLSEGIVHIDQAQPGDPAMRRPAFDVVREVATIWDPVLYLRSGARQHMSEARELQRQAQASSEAGNPLAAAVQAGAAEGHKEVALDLVRAAQGEPSPGG
jgi:hypothetical protein